MKSTAESRLRSSEGNRGLPKPLPQRCFRDSFSCSSRGAEGKEQCKPSGWLLLCSLQSSLYIAIFLLLSTCLSASVLLLSPLLFSRLVFSCCLQPCCVLCRTFTLILHFPPCTPVITPHSLTLRSLCCLPGDLILVPQIKTQSRE